MHGREKLRSNCRFHLCTSFRRLCSLAYKSKLDQAMLLRHKLHLDDISLQHMYHPLTKKISYVFNDFKEKN